jgi:hypothetical protein
MVYYIYCIWVKTEDRVLRYYGHTENMRVRKGKHVSVHKAWVKAGKPDKSSEFYFTRSVYVLEHEDWRMDVVDTIECETKVEASTLEGKWILENECVNMNVPGRTKKECDKQYRETHKAELAAKRAVKVTCEVCGSVVGKGEISSHRKTKKHQKALNALNSNINTNE